MELRTLEQLRIYIPMKHAITSDLQYQRTEGGFWFTETVKDLRRTFRIHERTMRNGFLVETLEELDPDFVALPCWPLLVQPLSETILSAAARVLHIPEFSILCCSLESFHTKAVQEWLTLTNISVLAEDLASAEKKSQPHPSPSGSKYIVVGRLSQSPVHVDKEHVSEPIHAASQSSSF